MCFILTAAFRIHIHPFIIDKVDSNSSWYRHWLSTLLCLQRTTNLAAVFIYLIVAIFTTIILSNNVFNIRIINLIHIATIQLLTDMCLCKLFNLQILKLHHFRISHIFNISDLTLVRITVGASALPTTNILLFCLITIILYYKSCNNSHYDHKSDNWDYDEYNLLVIDPFRIQILSFSGVYNQFNRFHTITLIFIITTIILITRFPNTILLWRRLNPFLVRFINYFMILTRNIFIFSSHIITS